MLGSPLVLYAPWAHPASFWRNAHLFRRTDTVLAATDGTPPRGTLWGHKPAMRLTNFPAAKYNGNKLIECILQKCVHYEVRNLDTTKVSTIWQFSTIDNAKSMTVKYLSIQSLPNLAQLGINFNSKIYPPDLPSAQPPPFGDRGECGGRSDINWHVNYHIPIQLQYIS